MKKSIKQIGVIVPFLKFRFLYYILSGALLTISIAALSVWGITQSIDFKGGTLVEFRFPESIERSLVEDALQEESIDYSSIQTSGDASFLIRGDLDSAQIELLHVRLASESAQVPTITREEIVGPIIGAELLRKMMIAAGLAILGILVYVALTFKSVIYGVAAIAALLHDTVLLFGAFALLSHFYGVEADALFVTAVLTTMSFSVHDTIVVFDRIREKLKENPEDSFMDVADLALTETMTRSVNNSLTIIFMLLALFLLGGATTKWFILALLIGTISGTYSSPFVATPILFELQKRGKK